MSRFTIVLNEKEVKLLSQLIENVLFKNGYDIYYDEYLKSLYELKTKLKEDKPQKIECK